MRKVRFLAMESFKGRKTAEGGSRTAVNDVDKGMEGLTPELTRQIRFRKHASNVLREEPIEVFGNSILLRLIPGCMASDNAVVDAVLVHLLGHVLTTLIVLQSTDPEAFVAHIGMVELESGKLLGFCFQKHHNSVLVLPINVGDPIAIATKGLDV